MAQEIAARSENYAVVMPAATPRAQPRPGSSRAGGTPVGTGSGAARERVHRARVRRRRAVALGLLALAVLAGCRALGSGGAPSDAVAPGVPWVARADGAVLARLPAGVRPAAAARRLARVLPAETTRPAGRASIRLALDVPAAVRSARAGARDVRVPWRIVSASVPAPVVAQKLRNNCESAALQVLLATRGVRVDQLTLQAELPRSGPPDPSQSGTARRWGDPDRGFVGRPEGGGSAGGFGVYPGPVAGVARRNGVALRPLTGASPAAVYARLREGRAVMTWVGLTAGPYESWRTPEGREVSVNFGEHTVVLTGVEADGSLSVVNVLQGTRERWSRAYFETLWSRLGRRALST